jgi:enoyl-CoA hydratase/carnithine racemase
MSQPSPKAGRSEKGRVVEARHELGVAVLTMANHPANALSNDLITAMDRALDEAIADEAVRTSVFDSAVDGFFAAGADLKLLVDADGGFTVGFSFGPG